MAQIVGQSRKKRPPRRGRRTPSLSELYLIQQTIEEKLRDALEEEEIQDGKRKRTSPKIERGHIKCSTCHGVVTGPICSHCLGTTCYIDLYWKGKKERFFRYYLDGELFDFTRAKGQLLEMNSAIKKRTFNPLDWSSRAIAAIRLSHQAALWLDMKEDEARSGELSFQTLKSYKGYVKNYFIPYLGVLSVRDIRYENLERFKDELRRVKGIKTRRNIMVALHALFSWMRRRGTITELPLFPIIEGENAKARIALDYETQKTALAKMPEKHRDVLEFGMETGLRSGEITALKVGDIDIINHQVLIQRTWSAAQLRETTKGKSKKWIPLSDRAFEIAVKNSKDKLPSAFVFINPDTGRHYINMKLNELWQKYSGIDCDYYSASRHSFCTQIVQLGANYFDAQELMRHVDIRDTMRYYHPTSERQRGLVNMRGKQPIARLLPEPKEAK